MNENKSKDIYIDEPVVASFFVGELGWFLQRWNGYLRYLKHDVYPDHKFIVMMNLDYHVFINDFVTYTIDLPKEFYDLHLETDCYEAPLSNSPPGSFTPTDVWASLITYFRNFYNVEEAEEVWTPRGYNLWVDKRPQLFQRYASAPIKTKRPLIIVFPRGRARAAQRNVPEFIWRELVDKLKKDYTVVLGGTPSGSFLADYKDKQVINLINYTGEDKMEQVIGFLNSAVMSVSSQSGPTHISLMSGCPSYIIGHEKERHAVVENRLSVPVSFRYLEDYRAIDADTILSDIKGFESVLTKLVPIKQTRLARPSMRTLVDKENLVGAEIGVFEGFHALNILQNLDIKKLYLIDPYTLYPGLDTSSGTSTNEDFLKAKIEAKKALELYKDKIVWIESPSSDAVKEIKGKLDFVYIDGNHRYEYASGDIRNFYPKVKDGGLIAGHDYDEGDPTNGVKKAVNKFFKRRELDVFSAVCSDDSRTNDWWVFKSNDADKILDKDTELLNRFMQ
jgi:hypothetical protein